MSRRVEEYMKTHKNLEIWKRGVELVTCIYRNTATFPKQETYGVVSQMRRAALSFPSNIAEGAARSSKKEFVQFVYIALGSLAELETQLIVSGNLDYLKPKQLLTEVETLRRMTLNFIKHLKSENRQ
jgi:four helix bundle protein